jgi:hypothetical protein
MAGEKFYQKYAWLLLFVPGILFTLSSIALAVTGGFDMSSFEESTGTTWSAFSAAEPAAAAFIIQLERLIGIGSAGFALFAAAIAWTGYRRGEQYTWHIMWLFPIILGVKAIVFFNGDAVGLGGYYGGFAVVTAIGLLLPYRKFFRRHN